MNKTNYHYIHFPTSLLKDVIERKEHALKDIKQNFENENKTIKGCSHCSIKMSMLDEFINHKKTEKQWCELLGYLAIKSILGKKKYIKTNYKHILSRMLGLDSYNDLINVEISESQNKLIDQYTRNNDIAKDKMKKLIDKLEADWKVITYGTFTRGIYVSMVGKCTINELVKIREEQRLTNKVKAINKEKRDALLNYRATLNPSIKSNEFE